MDNPQVHENVCPYLGLRMDSETRFGFPNPGNHCHREKTARAINLDYQQNVCLSYQYQRCPIFLQKNGGAAGALIQESDLPLGAVNAAGARPPAGILRLLVGIILIVGSLAGMYYLSQNGFGGVLGGTGSPTASPAGVIPVPTATQTPSPTAILPTQTILPPTFTPFPSQTASMTPTATETGTATATPTATATATFPPFIPPTATFPPLFPTFTPTPFLPSATPFPPTNTPIPPTNTPPSDNPTPTPTP